MKILAGDVFHQRNPMHAPAQEPAMSAISRGSREA
jgi:hypothetical protein